MDNPCILIAKIAVDERGQVRERRADEARGDLGCVHHRGSGHCMPTRRFRTPSTTSGRTRPQRNAYEDSYFNQSACGCS